MTNRHVALRRACALAIWVVVASLQRAACAAPQKPQGNPPQVAWADVESVVDQHFAAQGLQPADLLARSDLSGLWNALGKLGWNVVDAAAIENRVPADDSFLVRMLRSPEAVGFMRKVGGLREGYDRVERLSRLPRGERMLRDLMKHPSGHKFLQYMAETTGGENLGKQLSNAPRGRDFNAPTGKLYTPKALLDELKRRYDAAGNAAPKAGRQR